MKYVKLWLWCVLLVGSTAYAQDDLLAELEEEMTEETSYTIATFKGTRLMNGHTIKTRKKGELEFIIQHRFGTLNSGAYELFGLDIATMKFSLDYGISDRLNIGIGRSSADKMYDGFLKYKLLQQSTGEKVMPVTVTGLLTTSLVTVPKLSENPDITFTNRLAYGYSLLISRKFSPSFSFQFMPVFLHKNRVQEPEENNHLGLGTGFRLKLNESLTFNGEYYLRLNQTDIPDRYNSVAIGFDIETGGHVFQLHLTNSKGMIDRTFLSETAGDIGAGDIYFGFNISRTFQVSR